jgi:hypothetical protein
MNGRVYDPLVSRFLSPDLFVQAPGKPQSFNRYAYVFNNPLSFIDPSGYSSITLTGFGAQQFWAWYLGQHNSEGTPGIDMSFGMMTALGGSGSSYGGSSLSGGSSSSWTSFNWYNWDKNKSFWKNLRENFNRGFRGRLGDGRELVGLERNRSFGPTNSEF